MSNPTLTNILLHSMQRQAEQLTALGNGISAVAQVLEALHLIDEVGECRTCPNLPPALSSGYVIGGLTCALDALGGEVSRLGECLGEQLKEVV